MTKDLETVQRRINALNERVNEVVQQANSSAWPYSALTAEVRLFARHLGETAASMLVRAGHEIGVTVIDCASSRTGRQRTRIVERFTDLAEHKDVSVTVVTAVAFASCDCYLEIAATLVTRAEACIRGEQTISGTKIARGPLWDK